MASQTLAALLRAAMHLAFVVLLTLGALRAITVDGVPALSAIGSAVLIAALYTVATLRARRRRGGADLLLPSRGWVALLLLTWVGATLVSAAFVWLAFPLFFLVLFALGRLTGPLVLLVVAAWAVLAPLVVGTQDALSIGEVMGPLVGAVFSLVAHTVWRRLLEESERNRRLVIQLRAAQSELAESERRKGIAEERERLAQDLHDTLAQGLNSIVLLSRAAGTDHPEAAADFARIEDTARANLSDARHLVRDLADHSSQTTLEQALRLVLSRAEQLGTDTRLELRSDGTARELTPESVETLQRAAQSLVANVLQHAQASRCVLTLAWWPDRVSLDVADDGRGFDPAAPLRASRDEHPTGTAGGDGLRLLRSRLARAGGTVTIDSAPGEGTTVGLTLPLHPDSHPVEPRHPDPQHPGSQEAGA